MNTPVVQVLLHGASGRMGRALLRLARPARELGVQIITPARWQQLAAG